MAKNQKWSIQVDGDTYNVEYFYSPWSGMKLDINGEVFAIPLKPIGLFTGKKETIKLGEKQCIFVVFKSYKADIVVDGKYVGSGLPYDNTKSA